jgi:hypothetical protein
MAAFDSLKNWPAAAGNAALAALVFCLADWGPEFLDLVFADFVPCAAALTACGDAVLAFALGGGVGAALGLACGSACAQEVWGPKAVKSSDRARGIQRFGMVFGGM